MKFLIILSVIALAVATPIDDKSPTTYDRNTKKDGKDPVPLNKAPLTTSTVDTHPLHKRDAPKTQPAPALNNQKTQPEKPLADSTKTSNVNRKARDSATKTGQTLPTVNAQAPKANNNQQPPRKTATAPKPTDVKTPTNLDNKNQKPAVATSPQQPARVPLTSTNSRSRRDTPKVTKDSASPAATLKADNTQNKGSQNPSAAATKPKRDSNKDNAEPQKTNSQPQTIAHRRPASVDEVLRQKAPVTEAPKVSV